VIPPVEIPRPHCCARALTASSTSGQNGPVLRRVLTALLFCLAVWAGTTCLAPAPLTLDAHVDPPAQLEPAGSTDDSARWIAAPRAAVSVSSQWTPNPATLADVARAPRAPLAGNRGGEHSARTAPFGATHLRRIPLLI
jgi:hypothetical protein